MRYLALFSAAALATIFNSAVAECIEGQTLETPSSDFVVAGDIVTHQATGLMWSRCSLGLTWNGTNCVPTIGVANAFTWMEALSAVNAARLGGYSDWRLPNKNELMSIVDHACTGPAINEAVFPDTPVDSFWTSSPSAINEGSAWRVVFTIGDLINDSITRKLRVRLVRGD